MKNDLVIVESPTKARKIQGFLGKEYVVKSSQGHIRDLQDNSLSIDIQDNFRPRYVIPSGKDKLVRELKKDADAAETVWLASDEDREGEAIAWHLSEVLGLDKARTKRIAFHEITKQAILEAIEHPRDVDMNLVSAQQARRVLDRLVGFELSPVLWKKIQPKLSAGRVQSVALRLVVDKEREILAFNSEPYYRITASFVPEGSGAALKAYLDRKFASGEEARSFLDKNVGASYRVSEVKEKAASRCPAPPFTTSTLQQEAAHKLGFGVNQTMQIAQKLYEEGLITYMRTDSVNLSSLAINTAKKLICDNFGPEYSKPRRYATTAKGAQEAHEAIRPTYIDNYDIKGTPAERKLYRLIWQRTVASQMADAKLLNTAVTVVSDSFAEKFSIEASKVIFDGFLKLRQPDADSAGDEDTKGNQQSIDGLVAGTSLNALQICAEGKFTAPPQRYSQATLIKKLEDLQIGRPSTYASIISTLVKGRGYIIEGDKEGKTFTVTDYKLENGVISQVSRQEKVGAEKKRLLPQDIGMMVTDYLVEHFSDILDYGFTANVEKQFDDIASGSLDWTGVISAFYGPFHNGVSATLKEAGYSHLERQIGIDPADGRMITAKYGQWGPYVQKGEGDGKVCASLSKGQIIESLTLEEAVKLFGLPRTLGASDGITVTVAKGRYGNYIKFGDKNVSLPRNADPLKLTLEEAVKLVKEADAKPAMEILAEWGDIRLIKGRYGPFLKAGGKNYRIPAGKDASNLTEDEAKQIIGNSEPTSGKRRFFKKKSR